ncbi:MAG: hypothetical protein AAF985_16565, partial [Bacteroidota bacterium]
MKINIKMMFRQFFVIRFLLTIACWLWIQQSMGHTILHTTHLSRADLKVGTELIIEDPLKDDPIGTIPNIMYAVNRQVHAALVYGREQRSDLVGQQWSFRIEYDLFDEDN